MGDESATPKKSRRRTVDGDDPKMNKRRVLLKSHEAQNSRRDQIIRLEMGGVDWELGTCEAFLDVLTLAKALQRLQKRAQGSKLASQDPSWSGRQAGEAGKRKGSARSGMRLAHGSLA